MIFKTLPTWPNPFKMMDSATKLLFAFKLPVSFTFEGLKDFRSGVVKGESSFDWNRLDCLGVSWIKFESKDANTTNASHCVFPWFWLFFHFGAAVSPSSHLNAKPSFCTPLVELFPKGLSSQNRSEQPEHPMATTRHTAPLPHSSGSPSSHAQFQPLCSSAPFASRSTSPAQCRLLSFEVPLILRGNYPLLPLLASAI